MFSLSVIERFLYYGNYVSDIFSIFSHSHKKHKHSLEGSLVRVLFAAELEFPKILIFRLPQNTSNVNIENTRRSKQPFYFCDQLTGALIYLHFIVREQLQKLNTGEKLCRGYYSR